MCPHYQDTDSTYEYTNGWQNEENTVYKYDQMLFGYEKCEVPSFLAVWIATEDTVLGEISQDKEVINENFLRLLKFA